MVIRLIFSLRKGMDNNEKSRFCQLFYGPGYDYMEGAIHLPQARTPGRNPAQETRQGCPRHKIIGSG
jgi:hypothetical protein